MHVALASVLVSVMHDANTEFGIRTVRWVDCGRRRRFAVPPLIGVRPFRGSFVVQNSHQSIVHCVGKMIGMDYLIRVKSILVAELVVELAVAVQQLNIEIGRIWDRFVKVAVRFDSVVAAAAAADAAGPAVAVAAAAVVVAAMVPLIADSMIPIALVAYFQIDTMAGNFPLFLLLLHSLRDGIGHGPDLVSTTSPLILDTFLNSPESYPCCRTFANSRVTIRPR